MAHLYLTVIVLLMGCNLCEMRKRQYYFRQHNAKTNDNTVPCCLMLLDADSRRAHIDHITGQCDTTATINTNKTGLIKIVRLEYLFTESYHLDTGDLPAVLGYEEDGHDARTPVTFALYLTFSSYHSWITFNFMDGTYSRFRFTMDFLRSSTNTSVWEAMAWTDNSVVNGATYAEFHDFSDHVEILFDGEKVFTLLKEYRSFDHIRFSSNVATCSRISFHPA